MTARLADRIAAMTEGLAGVAVERVTDEDNLWPEEQAAIAQAVPARRAEFAAGRRAARRAMEAIGHRPCAVPMSADRAPVWPSGFVGSIAHDQGVAAAIFASAASVRLIALDLTEAAPLPPGTAETILRTPQERTLDGLAARAVFGAKECVFKALYPVVGHVFGFAAVEVDMDLEIGVFRGSLREDLGPVPAGARMAGRVARVDRLIVTTLCLNCFK